MKPSISRPSPALLVALLALVVAMSGTAYAALGKNSVGSSEIKNNSLRSKDLKDGQVGAADLAKQKAFVTPTLGAGFTLVGGGFSTPGYMKDSLGYVHLKGYLNCPQYGIPFTLPAGHRPAEGMVLPMAGSNGGGRIEINPMGRIEVFRTDGFGGTCSLDGLSFPAAG